MQMEWQSDIEIEKKTVAIIGGCRPRRRRIRRNDCAKEFWIIIVIYFFHVIQSHFLVTIRSNEPSISGYATQQANAQRIPSTNRLTFIFLIFVGTGRRFSVVGGRTIDGTSENRRELNEKVWIFLDLKRFVLVNNKICARRTVGEWTSTKLQTTTVVISNCRRSTSAASTATHRRRDTNLTIYNYRSVQPVGCYARVADRKCTTDGPVGGKRKPDHGPVAFQIKKPKYLLFYK